ncbi:MAG: aminotransferase class V-fold PLP-dependent enzyme, partial [Acetobacteraceae bacterium]|nr:aminotransferase class V-fold PLP-dependent enzyme [Acetobacteraceae bacterium]
GAHALAVSSHKIGGPTGAGALLLAPDAPPIAAHLPGGGQESGRRGGTPALAMIAGFAAACREAVAPTETAALRDGIDRAAVAAGAQICGGDALRLPNTTCLALPGVRADTQVITLDLAGFSVSAGAACSSGKVAVSHVLTAMGLGPLAGEAIRVSLPWNVADTEVAAFSAAYAAMAGRLLRRGQAPALAPHVA